MAMMTYRLDDDLKENTIRAHKELNSTPSETATQTMQYVAEHRRLPFLRQSRTLTAPEVAWRVCMGCQTVRDILRLIETRALMADITCREIHPLYQQLSRAHLILAEDLCWLHSAPDLTDTLNELMPVFARARLHMASSEAALGGGMTSDRLLDEDDVSAASASLNALDQEVIAARELLLSKNVFPPPTPVPEYSHNGYYCAIRVSENFTGRGFIVTITQRADLVNLLSEPLNKGLYLPQIPGWMLHPDDTYRVSLPNISPPRDSADAAARYMGGGPGSVTGFCFHNGKSVLRGSEEMRFRTTEEEKLRPERIAETVSDFIENGIRKILQGAVTEKGV